MDLSYSTGFDLMGDRGAVIMMINFLVTLSGMLTGRFSPGLRLKYGFKGPSPTRFLLMIRYETSANTSREDSAYDTRIYYGNPPWWTTGQVSVHVNSLDGGRLLL